MFKKGFSTNFKFIPSSSSTYNKQKSTSRSHRKKGTKEKEEEGFSTAGHHLTVGLLLQPRAKTPSSVTPLASAARYSLRRPDPLPPLSPFQFLSPPPLSHFRFHPPPNALSLF
ncbi:hypothetical protein RJT34_14626 [Clitoria ternatea]|uniref:Uncharacterized protein n=1 Tax=Clitoria ternatea TaxID=43366 RepID=A0AAN9JR95_CLITE